MSIPDTVIFYSTNAQTGEVTETVHVITDDEKAAYSITNVPSVVSMRQARLALLQSGLLAQVDAAIASGAEADKISWEYATEVNRNDALVTNMAAALNLSEGYLNNLFILAGSL